MNEYICCAFNKNKKDGYVEHRRDTVKASDMETALSEFKIDFRAENPETKCSFYVVGKGKG